MFTGLVEQVGLIESVKERTDLREFTIGGASWRDPLTLGESIAVDGICLTVAAMSADAFTVQAILPTLERTTAGSWDEGREVNLERALRADSRLGGHFVQGHVDAVGSVVRAHSAGADVQLDIQLPAVVAEVTVLHGSIAVDGVSLTVSALSDDDVVRIALIPHTLEHTNLNRLQRGSLVNLEGDMLGRFVTGYLKRWALPALG